MRGRAGLEDEKRVGGEATGSGGYVHRALSEGGQDFPYARGRRGRELARERFVVSTSFHYVELALLFNPLPSGTEMSPYYT